MSSLAQEDVVQKYSCRCLNVIINAASPEPEQVNQAESDYLRAFVGENGICISHHYLTIRTRFHAENSRESPNKLVQPLALSCLACNTLVYRVVQEISPEAQAREGPVVPTEEWVEQETLRSKSGWIEVFVGQDGCLVGQHSIEQHLQSTHFSRTFSVAVLTSPLARSSTLTPSQTPLQTQSSPPGSPIKSSVPPQLLPSLPPLFPPPPFTPAHPVFISLSTCAAERSTELRKRAEEETRRFVQSQLDSLEKEESQLRRDVEGIWRAYRDAWKELLGRVRENQQLSTNKPEKLIPSASAKSGAPMSIRDFSPVHQSHSQLQQSNSTPSQPMPFSLLSKSLAHSEFQSPTMAPQSPEFNTATPERTVQSSQSHTFKPIPHLQHINGARSSSSSISIRSDSENRMPGAFRRNMDTSVDIASSVAWAKGEEEMRRRLGRAESEPTERARKRTSKDLGIGAAQRDPSRKSTLHANEVTQTGFKPHGNGGEQQSSEEVVDKSNRSHNVEAAGHSSVDGTRSPTAETSDASGGSRKPKRRVTFDVLPDVVTMTQAVPELQRMSVPEVELFDLDDLFSSEAVSDFHSLKRGRSQPVVRTPSYKLRVNDDAPHVHAFQPASMPPQRAFPPLSPVTGKWAGGLLKRSVDLADALPLLSSSVPVGDRVLETQATATRETPVRTPSPPLAQGPTHLSPSGNRTVSPGSAHISDDAVEPAEVELKHLLAASAPSHRHAWREGGKAWEIFHKRSRAKKMEGAIAEEESDQSIHLGESESSSEEDDASSDKWRNPSKYASSLPLRIRPLTEYKPSLEPKTSLADKQGLLVPPLKLVRPRPNSAAAFRRAAYAERDRIRSIDPGPALDFNEQEEIEGDYLPEEIVEGERGRRHALSILQARSIVPEAGMWRSMTS